MFDPGISGVFVLSKSATISSKFTLGRNERLKSRKLIEQVFQNGKKLSVGPLRILFIQKANLLPGIMQPAIHAGFGVGTRYFKRAVDRNRVKRLMRESYRLQKQLILMPVKAHDTQLAVFFLFTGKAVPEYRVIHEKMELILHQLAGQFGGVKGQST